MLTPDLETYLRPEDFADLEPVDVAMEGVEEYTPMPTKGTRKYVMPFESGDEDSHFQTEDEDYVTPKALQRKAPRIHYDDGSDSNVVEPEMTDSVKTDFSDQEWPGGSKDDSNRHTDRADTDWLQDSTVKMKKGKASKEQDAQVFETIDLAKKQKRATGTKERNAF